MDNLEKRIHELECLTNAQTLIIDTLTSWARKFGESKNVVIRELSGDFTVQYVKDHPERFTKEALAVRNMVG